MTTPTTSKVVAEHGMYQVVPERVKSQLTLDGVDWVYAITNKETGIVEGRGANLPDALGAMYQLQLAYDNITKQAQQLENSQGLPPEHPSG